MVAATEADLDRQPSRGWSAVRLIGKILAYLTVPASLTIGPHITSIVGMLIPLYMVAAIGFAATIRGARVPPLLVNVGLALLAWYCILFAIEIANNDLARDPRPIHADFLTTYFVLLAFPFFAIGLREVRADLATLDHVVMATVALAAGWSLYQFFFMNVGRPGGFNDFNPIPYAMVVSTWSVYLLARALRSRHVDLVKGGVALLGLVPILLSGSKLVWGCAAVGYCIVFFAWVWAWRRWFVLGAVVLLTAVAGAALYPTRIVQSRLAQFTSDLIAFATVGDTTGPTFGLRFATAASGFQAFLERPFLGYGLADVKVAAVTHRPADIADFTHLWHLHNEYITHMVAFGILGLGFLLFLPAAFGALAWRTGDAGMRRFGVATTASLLLYMAAELVFARPNIYGTLFFLLGFLVVAAADKIGAARTIRNATMSEGARQDLEPTRWRIPSAPVVVMMVATLGGSVGLAWSQRSMMSATEPAALAELPLADDSRQEPIIAAGTIRWSFSDGGALGPQIVGELAVPERRQNMRVAIWKNIDDQLPASHIVELVTEPAQFPGRNVATVTAAFVKPAPDRSGQPLTGAAVTVAGNRFWIALSSDPGTLAANLDHLFGGEVFEFSMTYDTGRRAALAFEKGATGRDAFERARVAWGDGSTGF